MTKGSFSRDEWNHLLCLFNIMKFSMYSCIHFSNFLSDNSDQGGKQSATSKRSQETTSNEGSPTAKAKPCLVVHDRGVRKSLHEFWDLWSIRGMPMKEKKSKEHPRNWCYPTQIRKSDILQRVDKRTFRKQPGNQTESDEIKYRNSTSSRKLAASSPELKNMEYTNH